MTFIFFSTLAIKVKFEKKLPFKVSHPVYETKRSHALYKLAILHTPVPPPPTPDISLLVSRRLQVDKAPAARSRIKNQGLKIID